MLAMTTVLLVACSSDDEPEPQGDPRFGAPGCSPSPTTAVQSDVACYIQIKDIVSICPSISIENAYVEEDKSIIQGIIKVDVLYVPVEGLRIVYKLSEEIPFEHYTVIDNLTDTCKIFNTACIEKVEVDLNRDQIDLNMKVKRFTEAVDKKSESFIVKGDDLGIYDMSKAPSIIVYICKEGENLWNIAKKYNTTETEIAEINEIKIEEPLKAGKCLILEKKVVLAD